jgi:hypothetical protein
LDLAENLLEVVFVQLGFVDDLDGDLQKTTDNIVTLLLRRHHLTRTGEKVINRMHLRLFFSGRYQGV